MKIFFVRIIEEKVCLGVRHLNSVSRHGEIFGLEIVLVGEETIDLSFVVFEGKECLEDHKDILFGVYALKELIELLNNIYDIGLVIFLFINQVPAACVNIAETFEMILSNLLKFGLQQCLLLLIQNLRWEHVCASTCNPIAYFDRLGLAISFYEVQSDIHFFLSL